MKTTMQQEPDHIDPTAAQTVDIIGIPLFAGDIPGAVDLVRKAYQRQPDGRTRCISATGAHGLVTAQKDPALNAVYRRFYLNLPDGKPGVWVGRWKGAKGMERCYGPDFFAAVMAATAEEPAIRHFLCGGQPGVAEDLRDVCRTRYGNEHVVGVYSPPFRPLTEDEFADLGREIDGSGANFVWIGISTPKQEFFADALAKHTQARFIATVGAAFDFHTDRVRQAPGWIQQGGLEWLFRLLMEPRRLYRRYMVVVPAFIAYNIRDLLTDSHGQSDAG